jgi:hypothetical protein
VSDPQTQGQQWDPLGQTDQDGWQPAWPAPAVDQSQPSPQVAWTGQTQPGWDQQAPQPGWDQPVPQPAWGPSDPYVGQDEAGWPAGAQTDSDQWPADPQPDVGAHRHYQASAHTQYTVVRVLAHIACLGLIITGLSVKEDGVRGWTDVAAWAIFAATAAVAQTAPLVGRGFGLDAATSWTVGAVATASLVAYWVIIVLPSVSTNVGFALTMGTAAAVIGSWLSPGRQL